MTGSQTTNLRFDASQRRIVLIAARFNATLVDQLIDGAAREWRDHGGDPARLLVERVPGAFELPLAAKMFAASGGVDAVIALGCVSARHPLSITCGECARGSWTRAANRVPVIFGVLTTENQAQAEERADVARMNKGRESMQAALEMIQLLSPALPARGRAVKQARAGKKKVPK